MSRRHVIIALAALAGVFGELLALVSTIRIAGPSLVEAGQVAGRLGFPYDLRWTLFGVISVAGWVGAILWTSPRKADRAFGPWLNLPASSGAGVVVGLDHAVHADPSGLWPYLAFVIGPAITLTSSFMLHVISRMIEQGAPATSDRPGSSGVRSGDSPDRPGGNGDSVTYEPVEGARTTADLEPDLGCPNSHSSEAETPPDGVEQVAPIASGQAGIDAQIEWILGETRAGRPEPSADDVANRYGVARRTAFRRLETARTIRGATA